MNNTKKIYFASDFHLGVPTYEKSLEREKKIVDWLNHIEATALEIFLVGDIFDFWFEYAKVIPKGFVRLQAKIAERQRMATLKVDALETDNAKAKNKQGASGNRKSAL